MENFGIYKNNESNNNGQVVCITNERNAFNDNPGHRAHSRPIEEIPQPYREVFAEYPCFNSVQSRVVDDVLYADDSIVLSAPTGSGKTVIFELAIVRLLIAYEKTNISNTLKIVYVSPMKALCEERLVDWQRKFSKFGLNCISVTGDSDNIDFQSLLHHNVIITTPEKWDSLTRKWRDNKKFVQIIKLFMIDEVHLLNEENRGSSLEVVICRMKTMQNSIVFDSNEGNANQKCRIRFIAISATIPNIEDVAEWIGKSPNVKYFKFSESVRPVQLKKIVIGYPFNPKWSSHFKFDLALNYKLHPLIMQYSNGKPILIFCSTRKIVEMTAKYIFQTLSVNLSEDQKQRLLVVSNTIYDGKLKEHLMHGVGYHHAGMMPVTRRAIETLFRKGDLPILVTTSTLAMGVNLPAHLVIIKSTKCYSNGEFRDYTETALLQMMGRAGRPQFDTTATVLILTSAKDKAKFEKMVGGNEPIESNLHKHLTEHLNAEIVLRTITDLDIAMEWLSSTFLYIRATKNPRHYGLPVGLSLTQLDKKLLEMCQIELNKLIKAGMLIIDENLTISATLTGSLMAKYYIAFETMELFTKLNGNEVLQQILNLISRCHEFSEMYLRVNDKKCLNLLNKCKNRQTIRFPLSGKIKTLEMKINCIIQAVFGCIHIDDQSILSETLKILRHGERISKCLTEYLENRKNSFVALLNSITITKCFTTQLWENSPYISKQLPKIGKVISSQFVKAGKSSFQKIVESDPRELEIIIGKKSPLGTEIIEQVQHLPRYDLKLEEDKTGNVTHLLFTVNLINSVDLQEKSTVNVNSIMILLIGDCVSNEILLYEKYTHSYMIENPEVVRRIEVENVEVKNIEAYFISEDWVGIDCYFKSESKNEPIEIKTVTPKKVVENKNVTYIQNFIDMYMTCKKNIPKEPSEIRTIGKLSNDDKSLDCENNEVQGNLTNNTDKIQIHSVHIFHPDQIGPNIQSNDSISNLGTDCETGLKDEVETNLNRQTNEIICFNEEIAEDDNEENCKSINDKDTDTSSTCANVVNDFIWKNENEDFNLYLNTKNNNEESNVNVIKQYKYTPYKKLQHDTENERRDSIKLDLSVISKGNISYNTNPDIPKYNNKMKNKISWRSPLVYSPPVKFSPKLDHIYQQPKQIDNEISISASEGTLTTSSNIVTHEVHSRINSAIPHQKLNVQKISAKFSLRDNDYENVSENNNITTFKSNNHDGGVDSFKDLCSTSFLEVVGLIETRHNLKQANSSNSPYTLAMDYYSQLVSPSVSRTMPDRNEMGDYFIKTNHNESVISNRSNYNIATLTAQYNNQNQNKVKEVETKQENAPFLKYNTMEIEQNDDFIPDSRPARHHFSQFPLESFPIKTSIMPEQNISTGNENYNLITSHNMNTRNRSAENNNHRNESYFEEVPSSGNLSYKMAEESNYLIENHNQQNWNSFVENNNSAPNYDDIDTNLLSVSLDSHNYEIHNRFINQRISNNNINNNNNNNNNNSSANLDIFGENFTNARSNCNNCKKYGFGSSRLRFNEDCASSGRMQQENYVNVPCENVLNDTFMDYRNSNNRLQHVHANNAENERFPSFYSRELNETAPFMHYQDRRSTDYGNNLTLPDFNSQKSEGNIVTCNTQDFSNSSLDVEQDNNGNDCVNSVFSFRDDDHSLMFNQFDGTTNSYRTDNKQRNIFNETMPLFTQYESRNRFVERNDHFGCTHSDSMAFRRNFVKPSRFHPYDEGNKYRSASTNCRFSNFSNSSQANGKRYIMNVFLDSVKKERELRLLQNMH